LDDHRDRDVFQKDLENAFKIRRSTVSKTVELMEQKQLLERESVNGDGRMKRLRLTPKADAILAEVAKAVDELENHVRGGFSPEEYDTLMRLLKQLCGFLETPEEAQES
jgi:DNA-binding MarR family transcriptional regulator